MSHRASRIADRQWLVLAFVVVGGIGLAACSRLLGTDESEPRPFEHRAHAIEGISCVDCHEGISQAGETGPLHLPNRDVCVGCHEDPHNSSPCGRCHGGEVSRQQAAAARHFIRFRHDTHVERMDGQCMPCHSGASRVGEGAEAPMASCLSCHEHEDEFQVRDCESCHVDLQKEMPAPEGHLVHGPDVLRTHAMQAASSADLCTTCHTERFCAECHGVTTPMVSSLLHFDRPVERNRMHNAGFMARHALEASADPALCASCHSEPFCNECHMDRRVSALSDDAANPHPPGWVGALGSRNAHGDAARRDPTSCASCHGGAGQMLCVRCHQVGGIGGSVHPPGWDSTKSFSDLPCRFCHRPSP